LVNVRYMLVSRGLTNLPWEFALIPLGELPPGEYRVESHRSLPVDQLRFDLACAIPSEMRASGFPCHT
jgi:hypothetical protein